MSSSTSFKRRRRRTGTGYRNARLVPADQAAKTRLSRIELGITIAIAVTAAALIGLIWIVAERAVGDERAEMRYRSEQLLQAQAATIAETLGHELLVIDQSLKIIQAAWKQNSDKVDLLRWKDDLPALMSVADDLFICDEKHIIKQDIVASAVGQSVGAAYVNFPHGSLETYQSDGTKDRDALLLKGKIGPPIDARQFLMYVVRPLDHPRGWLLGASFRSTELTKLFALAGLGYNPVVALVELQHGAIQSVVGPASRRPNTDVTRSALYGMMQRSEYGAWVGESSVDGVERVHAFHRVPGRDMVVLVGSSVKQVMLPADTLAAGARGLAAVGSVLVLAVCGLVLWEMQAVRTAKRRMRILERNRKEIDRLREDAEAKTARAVLNAERLQIVLTNTVDGIALLDANQRLVQWNHPFERGIGVALRAEMPLETMLRDQIATGMFGSFTNMGGEIARRMTVLRDSDTAGLPQRGPDGETLVLRGLPLRAGGYMLLLNGLLTWEVPPPPPPAELLLIEDDKPSEPSAPAPIEW